MWMVTSASTFTGRYCSDGEFWYFRYHMDYYNELIAEIDVGSTSGTNYERPGNTYEANVGSMSGQRWWPKLAADVGPY